ncbi:target of rapamycin complex 2 subunit MAPKAP1 isoform X3 [Salmo salar]|uniref:Target of rapamycin complex 2 subunit MAPKAP1 n=1 Tax=Salmo salar TaxID=8030 RepID=A0ABM3C8Y8_SALSA|nr:target of rapamycin complex 2 subunit MAPKAP1 isoform X3 [Salmo salar]
MAFLDNPAIILAHIRQSHVTSDDTGMCEMVLIDHDVDLEKWQLASVPGSSGGSLGSGSLGEGGSGGENPGCDLSQSLDITSSWDFGIRRRSNTVVFWGLSVLLPRLHLKGLTVSPGRQQEKREKPGVAAQRLERLRKERQNQIKCKNIQWKERSSSQSAEDLGSLFEKRDFKDRPRSTGTKSTLSLRLEQCPQQLNNPFNEYSKFDGKGHVGTTATKKIDVYLSMQSAQEKLHPMMVVTIANARVHDLIGLICWQYTSEGREPKLKNAVHGFSLIPVDSLKVTMKEILQKALKKRKGSQKGSGPMYRLERQTEPNVPVDLDCSLESQSTLEFCLVRENSSRGEDSSEEDPPMDITTVQDMLSSHRYKSFKISMIHKLRFTTDVQLGISGEKVEIDPVTNQKTSTKFWIRQKPISIDSDHLCACDLVEERSPSHAIFKLTYLSNHDYKPLYFESDAATVNEIVLKVNYILESRASTSRADYFAQKQRKLSRRTSFSFQKEKK